MDAHSEPHDPGQAAKVDPTPDPHQLTTPADLPCLQPVDPWPDPIDGAELLDNLLAQLRRFVVFGDWVAETLARTLALWTLHTHAYQLRHVTTYIGIESPEKECGKSTLLTVLSQFVNRPAISANISSSAFFRAIEQLQPTLLIDEADTNLRGKEDLTGILNAGYTRSTAFVWRMSYDGLADKKKGNGADANPAGRVARFSCWCPKAIAGIGRLPPTLASRCIVVQMHRKLDAEPCERLRHLDGTELKRKCVRFVTDHQAAIASAEPKIPAGLSNRSADIWEPLLVLADLARGRWPELARQAALGLTSRAQERSPIGALLMDLCLIFVDADADHLFTRQIVNRLGQFGDRPWLELTRGKPLTETTLGRQLAKYGIRSRTVRIGDQTAKGYWYPDLLPIFRRYIPRSEIELLKKETAENQKATADQADSQIQNPTTNQ
jgi:putative DNA primase/helicase